LSSAITFTNFTRSCEKIREPSLAGALPGLRGKSQDVGRFRGEHHFVRDGIPFEGIHFSGLRRQSQTLFTFAQGSLRALSRSQIHEADQKRITQDRQVELNIEKDSILAAYTRFHAFDAFGIVKNPLCQRSPFRFDPFAIRFVGIGDRPPVLHARNVFQAVAEKLDESVVRQFDLLGFSIGDNHGHRRIAHQLPLALFVLVSLEQAICHQPTPDLGVFRAEGFWRALECRNFTPGRAMRGIRES
jgi:hypothetical protein